MDQKTRDYMRQRSDEYDAAKEIYDEATKAIVMLQHTERIEWLSIRWAYKGVSSTPDYGLKSTNTIQRRVADAARIAALAEFEIVAKEAQAKMAAI